MIDALSSQNMLLRMQREKTASVNAAQSVIKVSYVLRWPTPVLMIDSGSKIHFVTA